MLERKRKVAVLIVFATLFVAGCISQSDTGPEDESGEHLLDDGHKDSAAHRIAHKQEERLKNLKPTGVVKNGIREIELKTFQYGWEPEEIIVRAGEKVRLTVISLDVPHGFEVHGIHFDNWEFERQIIPGEPAVIEFTPESAGEYEFVCSVYCGADHSKMKGKLIVLE